MHFVGTAGGDRPRLAEENFNNSAGPGEKNKVICRRSPSASCSKQTAVQMLAPLVITEMPLNVLCNLAKSTVPCLLNLYNEMFSVQIND